MSKEETIMRQGFGGALLIAALALAGLTLAGTGTAGAGTAGAAGGRTYKAARGDAAPLKDCTRLNGRWGYYGNPWCTEAEQARFDRWDARRR
jgi:hypothetical protein